MISLESGWKSEIKEKEAVRLVHVIITSTAAYSRPYLSIPDNAGVLTFFVTRASAPGCDAIRYYGQHQVWTLQYLQPDNGRCMVFSIGQLDSKIGTGKVNTPFATVNVVKAAADIKGSLSGIGKNCTRWLSLLGTCDMYIKGTPEKSDPPKSCMEFFMQRCNSTKIYTPYTAACIKDLNSSAPTEENNHFES
ncbi:hypothetical protein V5799_008826 [Amblyomma americanum]|uniref:Uncharacterized protein n=1 Tax=Amblyomma americanum TaxID=6943 RepID=A0AAQ4FDL6_AMBAM